MRGRARSLCNNPVARGSCGPPRQSGELSTNRLHFAEFTLDLERGALLLSGSEISLRPKAFEVLRFLVEHSGQLISQQEILDQVWGDTVVTEDSVRQCINEIRKALGDRDQTMVRNVPRRGYRFDLPVHAGDGDRHSTPSRGARRPIWTSSVATGLALAVLAAAMVWWLTREDNGDAASRANAPPNSIAVLRFADLSPDGDQAYLSDGLAEEILHRLTQSRSLRVTARTSSFAVQAPSISAIGSKLNVAHVLEGSVRRSGDEIRVTVQLIDATTGTHLWSKTFDGSFGDILLLEKQIAEDVAQRLDVTLAAGFPQDTEDSRAYELFLQGRFLYMRRASGDLDKARDFYTQALAIDPEYAGAWVGLAAIANLRLYDREDRETDPAKRAEFEIAHEHAIEQALKFGQTFPEAHMRAVSFYRQHGDIESARQHFETARQIDPDHWLVRAAEAQRFMDQDRIADAVDLLQKTVLRDPLDGLSRLNLGDILLMAGRFEDARALYVRTFELHPSLATADRSQQRLARALILLNDPDDALTAIRSAPVNNRQLQGFALAYHSLGREADSYLALNQLESHISGPEDLLGVAEAYAYRGDAEQALAWLGRLTPTLQCRSEVALQDVFYSPFMAFLGDEPRWQAWRGAAKQQMSLCAL